MMQGMYGIRNRGMRLPNQNPNPGTSPVAGAANANGMRGGIPGYRNPDAYDDRATGGFAGPRAAAAQREIPGYQRPGSGWAMMAMRRMQPAQSMGMGRSLLGMNSYQGSAPQGRYDQQMNDLYANAASMAQSAPQQDGWGARYAQQVRGLFGMPGI